MPPLMVADANRNSADHVHGCEQENNFVPRIFVHLRRWHSRRRRKNRLCAIRSCTWLFSSTHSTMTRSGRFMYTPRRCVPSR